MPPPSETIPQRSKDSQSKADTNPHASDGTWRPALGRQQSWSEQEMKRKLSERLMGSNGAEGIEKGFTTGGEGKTEDK